MSTTLDNIVAFLNKYEGRDKLGKWMQYQSRLLMHVLKTSNPELSARFKGMFEFMRDARKIFRLFKGLNELQKIRQLVETPPSNSDEIELVLALLARVSFFGYWLYDNLSILAKIKFLKGDAPAWNKTGMLCWFFGNLFGFISDLRKIAQINTQAAYFRKLIKEAPEKAEVFKDKFKGLETQKATAIRGLLKSGFDGLTSFAGSGLAEKVGVSMNDGVIGFNGVVTGLVACYELYPK